MKTEKEVSKKSNFQSLSWRAQTQVPRNQEETLTELTSWKNPDAKEKRKRELNWPTKADS